MAAYVTSADVLARLSTAVQLQALDDNADGTADSGLLTAILDAASRWVDGELRRATEFSTPYPALATQAAIARAVWQVYERSGKNGRENPVVVEMERYQKMLADVAAGRADVAAAGSLDSSVADPADDTDDPSVFQDPTGL
jgi:phage gp36-like protein